MLLVSAQAGAQTAAMKSVLLACLFAASAMAQTNLNDVPADLTPPNVEDGPALVGHRTRATTKGWEGTAVHHTIFIPAGLPLHGRLPVIVEYAGNGGYTNQLGDTSDGSVEGCMLGYGLSGGKGFIWLCLPFVEVSDGKKQNAKKWWGDVEETKRYCIATVKDVCASIGDANHVVLMGFSRGAIACNYIGLHDDDIASLWCGMLCHSHYEGEFKHPAADYAAWPERLKRLGSRPQFISQEGGTQKTQQAIRNVGATGNFTFATLPFANHSARWVLCDLPIRQQARDWLTALVR
jgi:hypothetical protein